MIKLREFIPASRQLEGREPFETLIETIEDALNADWVQRSEAEEVEIRNKRVMGKFGAHWHVIATIHIDEETIEV